MHKRRTSSPATTGQSLHIYPGPQPLVKASYAYPGIDSAILTPRCIITHEAVYGFPRKRLLGNLVNRDSPRP